MALRAEVVGSLLRPDHLRKTRQAWKDNSDIDHATLKCAEDSAVDEALAMQADAGLHVVTDGEMRRDSFFAHFFNWDGYSGNPAPPVTLYHDDGNTMDLALPFTVSSSLQQRRMQTPEEFTYVRGKTDVPIKVTLPSPLMAHMLWHPEHSPQAYADPYDMFRDAARFLRREIEELAYLGCRYIQIDAPEILQVLIDPDQRERWRQLGIDPDRVLTDGMEILNSLADPLPLLDVTFALHVCRGNGASMWISQGSYERYTSEVFSRASNFNRFLMEYDDERSGGFEPLQDVPNDKVAVLGLVSTKQDTVEAPDEVARRIDEASKFIDLDNLAVSTQCGFGSLESGNNLSFESQESKLRVVAQVADKVWA